MCGVTWTLGARDSGARPVKHREFFALPLLMWSKGWLAPLAEATTLS